MEKTSLLLGSEQLRKRIKNVSIKAKNAVQYTALSLFMFRLFAIGKPPKQQNEPAIGKVFNAEGRIFKLFIFVHESSKGLRM